MEETNVDRAETSSVSPPPPTAEQIFGLRSLKNLLNNLRRMVPFYVYVPLYGKMYYTNRKLMDSIFSYLRVFRYPLDDLKAGTDELFCLCAEFMEINSKSHEEICERMNAMKEMVAQFQGKEGFNELPQDLRNEIYRRVLFEVALEKIVASIDNLISFLPIEI
ncbi:hypothetical protein AAC387_Pa07g3675 [Persea americana]